MYSEDFVRLLVLWIVWLQTLPILMVAVSVGHFYGPITESQYQRMGAVLVGLLFASSLVGFWVMLSIAVGPYLTSGW